MFITLLKIANRLDSIGEHDLADELDFIMKDITQYASKDKDKLEKDLKEVNEYLDDSKTSEDRRIELLKVKKNIEDDLEQLKEE